MPLSDATLAAISRLAVGTPIEDETDFTAMTPAEVAAKYELASYGGGGTLYALGSDGDYDALDPDLPPVTPAGLWAVGGFTNVCPNGLMDGAVAGSPGTKPTGWYDLGTEQASLAATTIKGLPAITVVNDGDAVDFPYCSGNIALTAAQAYSYSCIAGATVASRLLVNNAGGTDDTSAEFTTLGLQLLQNQTRGADGNSLFGWVRGQAAELTLAGPQAVAGAAVCPPILALSSAATTTHLAAITQREVAVWKPFVVVIEATTGKAVSGTYPTLYSLSKDTTNYLTLFRSGSTANLKLGVYSSGVWYEFTIEPIADNTEFKIAVAVYSAFIKVSVDNGDTQVFTKRRPAGALILESVGCNYGGGQQWNGSIQSCTLIHPAVWTDAQLEAA